MLNWNPARQKGESLRRKLRHKESLRLGDQEGRQRHLEGTRRLSRAHQPMARPKLQTNHKTNGWRKHRRWIRKWARYPTRCRILSNPIQRHLSETRANDYGKIPNHRSWHHQLPPLRGWHHHHCQQHRSAQHPSASRSGMGRQVSPRDTPEKSSFSPRTLSYQSTKEKRSNPERRSN